MINNINTIKNYNIGLVSFINPHSVTLFSKFKSGKNFQLDSDEAEYLRAVIPSEFSDYVHCNNFFYFVNYGTGQVHIFEKERINEQVKIFDLDRYDLNSLEHRLTAATVLIDDAIESYSKSCEYNENNYTRIKEVEIPNEKYDAIYSLTKEQTAKMNEWKHIHNKKYHKKGFGYQGASPISNFEVRFGTCALGSWAECVCLECMEYAKKETDNKKISKLKKKASFEVFNNL